MIEITRQYLVIRRKKTIDPSHSSPNGRKISFYKVLNARNGSYGQMEGNISKMLKNVIQKNCTFNKTQEESFF